MTTDHVQRGQTTLDFAIGVSVFLLAVAFVLTFTPSLVAPFTGGESVNALAANRALDHLTSTQLGGPTEPYLLDTDRTRTYFTSTTASELRTDVGVSSTTGVRLELDPVGGSTLAIGDQPPDTGDVVSGRRVVQYDGNTAVLRIWMW